LKSAHIDFFVADFGGFWRIEADFFQSAKIRFNPPKSAKSF
jgi:hypothetical protein